MKPTVRNAHERPPEAIREIFKRFQKMAEAEISACNEICDFDDRTIPAGVFYSRSVPPEVLAASFSNLTGHADHGHSSSMPGPAISRTKTKYSPGIENSRLHKNCYSIPKIPGLLVFPRLFDDAIQAELLSRMLHRDLADARHKTNVHMHYQVEYVASLDGEESHARGSTAPRRRYTQSFFSHSPNSDIAWQPLDPSIHKPLTIERFLNKSLRWVTLGGQYDWTEKVYPSSAAPPFPSDIKALMEPLFPEMKPQAAIVNVYSIGDTLSLHRDVSEDSSRGLVSISIGCDCLIVIGLRGEADTVVVRLHSGDAVYMSEEARYAWHGVPRIMRSQISLPLAVRNWPASSSLSDAGDPFEVWRGWMDNKRINLNVRQMFD